MTTLTLLKLVEITLAACHMPLRRLVLPSHCARYGWPARYDGMTFEDALEDCTRAMLLNVLHAHCPNLKGES